jgi:ABC-2 type transport system ATP-binding protein
MSVSAIDVLGLTHRFPSGRVALEDVRFQIAKGTLTALLGPNGSGKSTLFRILCTLLRPTSGTARLEGADLLGQPREVRGRIGVLFQAPGLDRKLTVSENLRHQGHLYGLQGKTLRQRTDELLARFGLQDRRDERVETLSGGLARRTEIAKALLHRPEILLLDEPGTGLDPDARKTLWGQLAELKKEGITILVTTHILEEAGACDRLLLLDGGKLAGEGTPNELITESSRTVRTLRSADPTLADRLTP